MAYLDSPADAWQTKRMEKRQFLICYDYGSGGLWGIMDARSESEIADIYPELQIARTRPAWMSEERFAELGEVQHHDIDGRPWGILNALIADRTHD